MNPGIAHNYSACDSRASRRLETLVLSAKTLIKYDCSEAFACLREAAPLKEKGRGPGRFVLESNDGASCLVLICNSLGICTVGPDAVYQLIQADAASEATAGDSYPTPTFITLFVSQRKQRAERGIKVIMFLFFFAHRKRHL